MHDAAMTILEQTGVAFLNLEAVCILKNAGCSISDRTAEGALVKLDRALVEEMVAKVPGQFDIVPRNPARKITIGGDNVVYTAITSPPN